MALVPITVKAARAKVLEWHRHLPDVRGGLFAVGVALDGELIGVAIAGNPARVWQGTGRVVITRVAARPATPETRGQCSMLYGAICRAAKALGYREAWTYTLLEEPGDSLRGAGFEAAGFTAPGEWDRPSRARQPARRADAKRRWVRRLAA